MTQQKFWRISDVQAVDLNKIESIEVYGNNQSSVVILYTGERSY